MASVKDAIAFLLSLRRAPSNDPMRLPNVKQIHLWSVDAVTLSERQHALLDASEQAHYARIRAPGIKQQYALTRWAIRHALSCYVPEVLPEQWRFSRNAYGRPAINSPHLGVALDFNISHARGALVMAFSGQGALGVDIEFTNRQCRALAVAQRYFSATEVNDLRNLPPQLQRARFFDLWTLKEAYIKACGRGLAIPLGSFSFSFAAEQVTIDVDQCAADERPYWRFWQFPIGSSHKLAIALGDSVPLQDITIEGFRLLADERIESLQMENLQQLS